MSKRLGYSPRLDGLRAIAALMVLCSHYFVEIGGPDFRYGGNGVQIFFVISGYLITMILLSQKSSEGISRLKLTGNFIIKRALRLFPVYYLFLTGLVIVSIAGGLWLTKEGTLWHYYTYTQNYLFFKEGFQSTLLNHTWSLAVEEQFYLFWPFIIFFVPKRAELPLLIAVFLTGVLSRIYFTDFYVGTANGTTKGVTFIHFDTLGAGALLAWCVFNSRRVIISFLDAGAQWMFLAGLIASSVLTYMKYEDSFFLPFSLVVMSTGLVYICTSPGKSFLDAVLGFRWLVRLGKVSYGLYLFHKPIPFFMEYIFGKEHLAAVPAVVLFTLYMAMAIGIAALSWWVLERHFLKLKEKFDL